MPNNSENDPRGVCTDTFMLDNKIAGIHFFFSFGEMADVPMIEDGIRRLTQSFLVREWPL